MVLTEAGKIVYASALEHRAIEHNLVQELGALEDERPALRVGMIDSVAALLTTKNEPLYTLEHKTELGLIVTNSSSLRSSLVRDKLDMVIVVADEDLDRGVRLLASGADRLVLVCRSDQTKAFQTSIDSSSQLPFISYMQDSKTYQMVISVLQNCKIRTNTVLYSTSPDIMLDMVRRGRGAAVLPERLVHDDIETGVIEKLRTNGNPVSVQRRLSIITLKGRQLPAVTANLVRFFGQELREY